MSVDFSELRQRRCRGELLHTHLSLDDSPKVVPYQCATSIGEIVVAQESSRLPIRLSLLDPRKSRPRYEIGDGLAFVVYRKERPWFFSALL